MPSNANHGLFRSRGAKPSTSSNDGGGDGSDTTTEQVKLTKEPEMRVRDGKSFVYLYGNGKRYAIHGKEGERDLAATTAHYARKGQQWRITSSPEPGHDGWRRVTSASKV